VTPAVHVKHTSHREPLMLSLRKLASRRVCVGVLGNAKAKRSKGSIDNVQLAAIHEFGTSTVPARPFIRPAVALHHEEYVAALDRIQKRVVRGADVDVELGRLGMKAVGDIRVYITRGSSIPPPLKPETIKRKGSSRALVDTGQLLRSIDSVVR
jgi:hypothetical protein